MLLLGYTTAPIDRRISVAPDRAAARSMRAKAHLVVAWARATATGQTQYCAFASAPRNARCPAGMGAAAARRKTLAMPDPALYRTAESDRHVFYYRGRLESAVRRPGTLPSDPNRRGRVYPRRRVPAGWTCLPAYP